MLPASPLRPVRKKRGNGIEEKGLEGWRMMRFERVKQNKMERCWILLNRVTKEEDCMLLHTDKMPTSDGQALDS